MNILYEGLPETVTVSGKEYRIVTDFREWIRFVELAEDDTVPLEWKVHMMLEWYIDLPEDTEGAVYALTDFMSARALYPKMEGAEKENGGDGCEPVFSFEEDAGCIYCAFFNYYGIDLEEISYLHWWKFRTLFEGLPEEAEIKKRIMYRQINLGEIKDKEERKRIKEIKKKITLHKKKRKLDDFEIGGVFT